MDRRRFVLTSLTGVLAAPRALQAQGPSKVARIGYLSLRNGPTHLDQAFQEGLRELGYLEGQNIFVEYRYADWDPNRVPALAEELIRLRVDLIVSTGGNVTALAVKKVVKTTPVVFTSGDPVAMGIVSRLDRPGANLTGVNLLTTELNAKRLELLLAAVPAVSRVGVLANPAAPMGRALRDVQNTAGSLGVKTSVVNAATPSAIDAGFVAMARDKVGALLVLANPMFFAERERIIKLASQHVLPAMFEQREFAEAGGLLSYGASIAYMYRRLATYVDKILRGANPGELPIEQPTKLELVINLKTAKALGLTIPPSLLARADQVID
jgi:putative ABC transport system substrate-binding protein